MVDWPASLPQYLNRRGANFKIPDNRLRSQVDVGVPKMRPLQALNVRPLSGFMVMTLQQTLDLETFVEDTLNGGTAAFNFPDPRRPGQILKVRFADELPEASHRQGTDYIVPIKLEVMP